MAGFHYFSDRVIFHLYVHIYTCIFLSQPVDGQLGCFNALTIVNSAAMNWVHISKMEVYRVTTTYMNEGTKCFIYICICVIFSTPQRDRYDKQFFLRVEKNSTEKLWIIAQEPKIMVDGDRMQTQLCSIVSQWLP